MNLVAPKLTRDIGTQNRGAPQIFVQSLLLEYTNISYLRTYFLDKPLVMMKTQFYYSICN